MDNCNLTLTLLVPKTHTSIPCCREVAVGSAVKRSRTMVDGKNHLTRIELQLYWFILPYVYSVRFVYQSQVLEKSSKIPLRCVIVPYLVMLRVVSWTIGFVWKKNHLMRIDLALCWSTSTFCFKLVVHQLPNVWMTKKRIFKSLKLDSKNKIKKKVLGNYVSLSRAISYFKFFKWLV